ncbi:MAG: protein kinase [Planctomycetes bacterium]|nr:protein kinase [Planctomycetota bacterium]
MQEQETYPRGLIIHERFRLGALRARGGMASIYEGTEIKTDRHVAIKFLRKDLEKMPEMVELFDAEAEALQKLDHPNIIRGLAAGRYGGSHYLVMDFVSGPTLRERLRWGRPERDEALSILRQAAAGLDHAHERGVVHRDIKPDNLILEKNEVRIADFGIARVMQRAPLIGDSESRGGTVIYSAPEQFEPGGTVGPHTDVYSLGVVAYEIFTGRVPFAAYRPASTLNHQVPRAADAVLERAFNENPSQRPAGAGVFAQALEAAFRAFAPDSTPAPQLILQTPPEPMKAVPSAERAPEPAPAGPRHAGCLPWILAGLVLTAATAAALAWAFGWGPFSRAAAAGTGPRVRRASAQLPPLEVAPPFAIADFDRLEAAPPAPAGLLLDRLAVTFAEGDDPGQLMVAQVRWEVRVRTDCENPWQDAVHVFRAGEVHGDPTVHRPEHEMSQPRIRGSRVDFTAGHPSRITVFLDNPGADLELDLASGTGTLVRRGARPQAGKCSFVPLPGKR